MDFLDISYLILTILLSLSIGIFLNVVIYRVPNNMSLISPASHCPKCNTPLKWYDNIPLLSYIILKGKCRYCKDKISPRYFIVELLNTVLSTITYLLFYKESLLYAVIVMLIISVLIIISFIDIDKMIILDRFQIILFILGIALFFAGDFKEYYLDKLLGLLIFGVGFLLIYYFFKFILKKEIIGGGDIKLLFSFGFILGIYKSLLGLLIASVSASIVYLVIKSIKNYDKNKEYPFGPFLAIGMIISLLFGDMIINFYLGLFSL